jgi:hypothetical protein
MSDPLATHCGMCGAKKGQPCGPVSKLPACPPPTREFHHERETGHWKGRNG